jgi:hypothetical protein
MNISGTPYLGYEVLEYVLPSLFFCFLFLSFSFLPSFLCLFFSSREQESELRGSWMKVVQEWGWEGVGEQTKPGFTQSVSVFKVKTNGAFCYFDGFSDDAGPVGPDVGYNFSFGKVHVDFSLCFVFNYCWSLILHSGASDTFRTPSGYATARLAYVHAVIRAGDLVNP